MDLILTKATRPFLNPSRGGGESVPPGAAQGGRSGLSNPMMETA